MSKQNSQSQNADMPVPHEITYWRCVPPQVANRRDSVRGNLVRGF